MKLKLGDEVKILSDKKVGIQGHNPYIDIDGGTLVGKIIDIQNYEWGHKVPEEYWTYTIKLKLPLFGGVRIRCQVLCKQDELEIFRRAEKS